MAKKLFLCPMDKSDRYYLLSLQWIRAHIRPGTLIILVSVLIGLAVGLAAVGLKTLLHFFEATVLGYFPRYLLFFLPVIGIFLVAAINRSSFKESKQEQGLSGV